MANYIPVKTPLEVPSTTLLNAGLYGAGAVFRLQSATSANGTYADVSGTGSTPTIAIVSGTEEYDGFDPNGTSATFYRARIENAGATRLSDWKTAVPTRYG